MADDWQVGDLAVCVNDDACPIYGVKTRRKGAIYRVIGMKVCPTVYGPTALGLKMDRDNPIHQESGVEGYSNAICFRKIRPADPEFIEMLASRKVKEPA